MTSRRWACPSILILTTLIAVLTTWLVSHHSPMTAANIPRTNYGMINLGDLEREVLQFVDASDRFILMGIFDQAADGPVWTYIWVQDGPIVMQLDAAEMRQNRFLANLGWTYPTHPPTHKVHVILATGQSTMLYVYFNEAGEVAAIYTGGT